MALFWTVRGLSSSYFNRTPLYKNLLSGAKRFISCSTQDKGAWRLRKYLAVSSYFPSTLLKYKHLSLSGDGSNICRQICFVAVDEHACGAYQSSLLGISSSR